MLARLYQSVLRTASSRYAPGFLALIAFLESSIFPIPPDLLLVPMVLARRDRAWVFATICTVASVVGGAVGYGIGYLLFDTLGRPLLALYHYDDAFARYQEMYATWGVWVILIKGLTPIPYKIVTIASGAFHFDFGVFMLASLVTRAGRFFLVAGLLRAFGEPVRAFIERRLTLVTSVAAAVVVAGFVVLRFI